MTEMDYWYENDDDSEIDEWDDLDDWYDGAEMSCSICGERDAMDMCQQCGSPLCSMHAELGCGFCPDHPDKHYRPDGDYYYSIIDRIWMWLKPKFQKRQKTQFVTSDDEIPF